MGSNERSREKRSGNGGGAGAGRGVGGGHYKPSYYWPQHKVCCVVCTVPVQQPFPGPSHDRCAKHNAERKRAVDSDDAAYEKKWHERVLNRIHFIS